MVTRPRALAMPVLTLSEKMCEMRFSCSGLARTTILILHSVWLAICIKAKSKWLSSHSLFGQTHAYTETGLKNRKRSDLTKQTNYINLCYLSLLIGNRLVLLTCLKLMLVISLRALLTMSIHSFSPSGSSCVPIT